MRNGTRFGSSRSLAGEWTGAPWDRVVAGPTSEAFGWIGDGGPTAFSAPPSAADFPAVFDLSALNGRNGFRLDGIDVYDGSGRSVDSAGDINGDGFDDLIIGTFFSQDGGESYVVFGKDERFDASLDLATLDGTNGFRVAGINRGDDSGRAVSSAGDVNGDGFDDFMIGAAYADPDGLKNAGETYVVFGKAIGFDATFELSTLNGSNGFIIEGPIRNRESGIAISSAGDVNGDGFDDVIIGSRGPFGFRADPFIGTSYVVFGRADGFTASLNLTALDGTNGYRIDGADLGDFSGRSVSSAGDVNGDGFDDVIVGAPGIFGETDIPGASFVVFGKASGFAASLDLASLDGTNGFRLNGIDVDDLSGNSVSSAGDINGDGFDDIIIGAVLASPDGVDGAGESYVVFGKADGFAASLDLATLDGANGFRLGGLNVSDMSGNSVSSAGDVNGDGFDDMLIGAYRASPGGRLDAGEIYVVFGKADGFASSFDLATLDGTNGLRIEGIDVLDVAGRSVASAGDVNGDGFGDIIIGADQAYPDGVALAGESYVIFGRAPGEAVRRVGAAADQTIRGGDFGDVLKGRGGDDVLAGGGGHDRLKGGGGADEFLLASRDGSDADTIRDFAGGVDRIALDGDVFDLREGALAPSRFIVGVAAADASDRLIYDDASGRLFFDADGTGAEAQVLIATLAGAPALTAGDFLITDEPGASTNSVTDAGGGEVGATRALQSGLFDAGFAPASMLIDQWHVMLA